MSRRRAIILIAGIIILAGIGCLIYLRFATPDDSQTSAASTAKQDKVYKDVDSKLTFTYPYNWSVAANADETKSKDIFVADNEGDPLAQLQLRTETSDDFATDGKVNLNVYAAEASSLGNGSPMYAICGSYAAEGAAIPVIGLSRYDKTTPGVLMSTLIGLEPHTSSPYKWLTFEMPYEEPPETEAEIQTYCATNQAKQLMKVFASLRLA